VRYIGHDDFSLNLDKYQELCRIVKSEAWRFLVKSLWEGPTHFMRHDGVDLSNMVWEILHEQNPVEDQVLDQVWDQPNV
jgi:hypothetical protein